MGAEALDRLVMSLGAKASLPVTFGLIDAFIQTEGQTGDWRYTYAALYAMCQVGEAAKDTDLAEAMQAEVQHKQRGAGSRERPPKRPCSAKPKRSKKGQRMRHLPFRLMRVGSNAAWRASSKW